MEQHFIKNIEFSKAVELKSSKHQVFIDILSIMLTSSFIL